MASTVDDVVGSGLCMLLMAPSGAGKSTLVEQLARELGAAVVSYDAHQRRMPGDTGVEAVTEEASAEDETMLPMPVHPRPAHRQVPRLRHPAHQPQVPHVGPGPNMPKRPDDRPHPGGFDVVQEKLPET